MIRQANSHVGLVWSPDSQKLYAAGGNDDAVYVYARDGGSLVAQAPIALKHTTPPIPPYPGTSSTPNPSPATRPNTGVGLNVQPNVAGLAISGDGKTLVVCNNYNDSISIIDLSSPTPAVYEHDLRQYTNEGVKGGVGGTFPFSVLLNGKTAYVGVDRDRELDVVDISNPAQATVAKRIKLAGNPNGMAPNVDGSLLYVTQDNADQVAVIDTSTNTIKTSIDTRGPASLNLAPKLAGAAPTAATISPDGSKLFVVNAGSNSIAVIPLTGPNAHTVTGLIPTAYDPTDVAFSGDGQYFYVVNGKSDTGPNPGYGYGNTAQLSVAINQPPPTPNDYATQLANKLRGNNQYQFQLEHATLVSAKVSDLLGALGTLTIQVAANNLYNVKTPSGDEQVMSFLRSKIHHIIYIVKENRTFDQILGDLNNGSNGDPKLTLFGKRITPNFHRLAEHFVTLDNFMDAGDGSMDGWSWSMRARVTNTETVTQQENYSNVNRGLSYEGEGQNRNIPANLPSVAARNFYLDPTGATTPYSTKTADLPGGTDNVLPGDGDHAATDGPAGYQQGYIFNAVVNAGGTIRNYGWLVNTPGPITDAQGNPISDSYSAGVVQTTTNNNLIYSNNWYDPHSSPHFAIATADAKTPSEIPLFCIVRQTIMRRFYRDEDRCGPASRFLRSSGAALVRYCGGSTG
ncbi:MAG: YncE family protein [Rhodopila sp.]